MIQEQPIESPDRESAELSSPTSEECAGGSERCHASPCEVHYSESPAQGSPLDSSDPELPAIGVNHSTTSPSAGPAWFHETPERADDFTARKVLSPDASEPVLTIDAVTNALTGSPARFFESDACDWTKALHESRALVLFSSRSDGLVAALQCIAKHPDFATSTEKLVLLLSASGSFNCPKDSSNSSQPPARTLSGFELCLLPRGSSNQDNPQLLIVDAADSSAKSFLDELFHGQVLGWETRKARLRDLHRYLIVLTCPEHLPQFHEKTLGLPVRRVPYHKVILSKHVPTAAAGTCSLAEQFELAVTSGTLGVDEDSQYKALEDALRNSQAHLVSVAVADSPSQPLGDDPLCDAILYLATFFPRVSEGDFQDLLLALIGERPDPQWQPPKESKTNTTPPLLRVRWQDQPERALRACGLQIVRCTSAGTLEAELANGVIPAERFSIEFDITTHRNHCAELFRTRHRVTFTTYFRHLLAAGTLFHSSPGVVSSFADLAIEVAATEPIRFGSQWLLELVFNAESQMLPQQATDATQDASKDSAVLRLALATRRKDVLHHRLHLLISGMLKQPALQSMVQATVDGLLRAGFHDVILQLTWQLARDDAFRPLFWLRRLVEEAGEPISKRAEDQLLQLALSKLQAAAVLDCREWMKSDRSKAAAAAMRLAVQLGERSLLSSPLERVAQPLPPGLAPWIATGVSERDALLGFIAHPVFSLWLNTQHCWRLDVEFWQLHVNSLLNNWFFSPQIKRILGFGGCLELAHALDELWTKRLTDCFASQGAPKSAPIFLAIVTADAVFWLTDLAEKSSQGSANPVIPTSLLPQIRSTIPRTDFQSVRTFWLAIEDSLTLVATALDSAGGRLTREDRTLSRTLRKRAQHLSQAMRRFRATPIDTKPSEQVKSHATSN